MGMGVLPLEFEEGTSTETLELDGSETVDVEGLSAAAPGGRVTVRIRRASGEEVSFSCLARLDSSMDVEYFAHGGLLPLVLRSKLAGETEAGATAG